MITRRRGVARIARVSFTIAACFLGLAFVGCTPEVEPTPSWTPSETPTPTPTWKPKEQAAIDAVDRYIDAYTDLINKIPLLSEDDWDRIYATTVDPRRTEMLDEFAFYTRKGWTGSGAPVFTVDRAESVGSRDDGELWGVTGCYVREEFFYYDSSGQRQEPAYLRSYRTYIVLLTQVDQVDRYYVSELHNQENAC